MSLNPAHISSPPPLASLAMASMSHTSQDLAQQALNVGHAARARREAATPRVTRKDFTDRLGLPTTATNQEFFAALEARLATPATTATPTPAAAALAADEQLYARLFADSDSKQTAVEPAPAKAALSDDALYARIYGPESAAC